MSTLPSLSIVIPCHNEEQAIPYVLKALADVRPAILARASSVELIVVDDGSTDGTAQLLRARSDLRFLRIEGPSGYGAALKTGFHAASGDLIAFFDMDGTYDPNDLPSLLDALARENADIVLGNRLEGCPGMSLVRGFGNRLFSRLVRALFDRAPLDVCSGYRVFRRACLPAACKLPQDGLNYSLAMTILMNLSSFRLAEIPISYAARTGRSKLNVPLDGIRFFSTILRHYCLEMIS